MSGGRARGVRSKVTLPAAEVNSAVVRLSIVSVPA
jgi:hypothetical protein